MQYAIVQIAGRQYKIEPDKPFIVNSLGDAKQLECDQVLMIVKDGKVSVGAPYLKEKLVFDVIKTQKAKKIRVAIFHAKANYRRVNGARATMSHLQLAQSVKTA